MKKYASLLLGISSLSLAATMPVMADDSEASVGTPIQAEDGAPAPSAAPAEFTYDQALKEMMKTQAHSQAAAKWGLEPRQVKVPVGADPNRVIEKEMVQAPGLTGLEQVGPDPKKVEPIKVEGSLSEAEKVPLDGTGEAPVAKSPRQQQPQGDEGGWNWVDENKGQAAVQQEPGQQQAAQPKRATGLTTVYDATNSVGTGNRIQPANLNQESEAAVNLASDRSESAAPSPGAQEEEQQEASQPAGEEEEAAAAPKSAAEVAKEAVTIYNSAVKLHLAGKLDEAITEYRQALEANPELSQAHCNLGLIFNQQHDYAKAISEFRKALAIDPKDAITYNGIGAALRAQKDMEGAIKNWKTAVTMDPKLATAHYNLGTAYEIQKDYDKAVEAYGEAIKNDFRLGEAYYRMGLINLKKNRLEDAKEQLSKAIQVSKNAEYCADARKRLAALEQGPTR